MKYKNELEVAKEAAQKAGDYLLHARDQIKIARAKGEGTKDYVTKQDLDSEQIIIETIKSTFPNDFILSEETGDKFDIENTNRFWSIDPIDGTRNFANGIHYFSVSIALFESKQVQVGVVYAPAYGNEMYTSIRGEGSFLNNNRLKIIDKISDLNHSVIVTGFAYFRGEELTPLMKPYETMINSTVDVLRMGSGALDTCQVAASRIGAFFESGLKPWDLAAGKLLVEESGGLISDFAGNDLDLFHKKNNKFSVDVLVAKNETIQKQIIDIIRNKT